MTHEVTKLGYITISDGDKTAMMWVDIQPCEPDEDNEISEGTYEMMVCCDDINPLGEFLTLDSIGPLEELLAKHPVGRMCLLHTTSRGHYNGKILWTSMFDPVQVFLDALQMITPVGLDPDGFINDYLLDAVDNIGPQGGVLVQKQDGSWVKVEEGEWKNLDVKIYDIGGRVARIVRRTDGDGAAVLIEPMFGR